MLCVLYNGISTRYGLGALVGSRPKAVCHDKKGCRRQTTAYITRTDLLGRIGTLVLWFLGFYLSLAHSPSLISTILQFACFHHSLSVVGHNLLPRAYTSCCANFCDLPTPFSVPFHGLYVCACDVFVYECIRSFFGIGIAQWYGVSPTAWISLVLCA